MITYGTNPGMGMPIGGRVPDPDAVPDLDQRVALDKALKYMDLQPGQSLEGKPVDVVFIGSCTNSRISDLRAAARLLEGRKIAENVRTLVVPGSAQVKAQAEAEGLHEIFKAAGAEWREGWLLDVHCYEWRSAPARTIRRQHQQSQFRGRQGKGGRTFLASPLVAAATAVNGVITDPRKMMERAD